MRRATAGKRVQQTNNQISIHALLAESDPFEKFEGIMVTKISIHALLAESDLGARHRHAHNLAFLSTLSLRRATWLQLFLYYKYNNFYPRSPCGERRSADCNYRNGNPISIHALLAESDVEKVPAEVFYAAFLSTLSLRRAT